ncbi:hypothetical protein [Azospirillum palustre]
MGKRRPLFGAREGVAPHFCAEVVGTLATSPDGDIQSHVHASNAQG